MRQYETDVSESHLAVPSKYLRLPENQHSLPALLKFYERYGNAEETPDVKNFPVLESLKMTRALHRSILILRSNGGDFQNLEYRLFLFHFRNQESPLFSTAEEYRFRGGRFSLSETSSSFTPVYRHHLAFRRISDNLLGNVPDIHVELSSDPNTPGRLMSENAEYLLDDIRTLDIPTITADRVSTPLGQLAVVRTSEVSDIVAS